MINDAGLVRLAVRGHRRRLDDVQLHRIVVLVLILDLIAAVLIAVLIATPGGGVRRVCHVAVRPVCHVAVL